MVKFKKTFIKIAVSFFTALFFLFQSPSPILATAITDSYTDTTKINTSASSNVGLSSGQVKISGTNIEDGDGADGAITVAANKFFQSESISAVMDSSSNATYGTPTGTVIVGGKYGNARNFNGTSDYITVAGSAPGSNLTIAAWVNPSANSKTIYYWGPTIGCNPSGQILHINASSQLYFSTGCGTAITSTATVPNGTWTHVAVTIDGSGNAILYVNGVAQNSATSTRSGQSVGTGNDMIGAQWNAGSRATFFSSVIDDVRTYDYVRSGTQISEDMNNSTITGNPAVRWWKMDERNVPDGASYSVSAIGTNTVTLGTAAVGLWVMDEASGTNVADSSGSGNNGTATGTTVVPGKYGNARSFAGGTDNVSMGNVLDQTGANPFSIEAWVKTTAGGATVYTIVSKLSISNTTGYMLGFNVVTASSGDAGKIGFLMGDQTAYPPGSFFRRQTTATYNDGNWHHVAVTYDGSKTRAGALIYVDGNLATVTDHDSASFTGSPSNLINFQIGARNGNNQPFNGQIDDVRIYNSVRTATQINGDRLSWQAGLASGDEVLLTNLQGDATNNGNVGNYEFLTVQSTPTNTTVTFSSNVSQTYGVGGNSNLTGQKIIIQRVPNYTNVTINSGVTLTANAWDGTRLGIIAFKATGTVNVSGNIDVSSKAYRGGGNITQGESYGGTGAASRNANLGAGGGGITTANNVGGGAGGSYGSLGTAGHHGINGSYGGQPGTHGGLLGTTYGAADLSKIYLGSAGGGGAYNTTGGTGGLGGGIIIIAGNSVTISGTINANGQNGTAGAGPEGTKAGGGGGGSGGSIKITSQNVTLGTNLVTATGGTGGNGCYTSCSWSSGGNGGDGRIAIEYGGSAPTGSTNPSANLTGVSGPPYNASATIQSTNLLSGETSIISSIDNFVYNLSSKPAGTTATVQFSQDATNWYNSAGTANGTDTLTTGANNTISLSSLGWDTANFYYKIAFGGDTTNTPVLDDITLNYTPTGTCTTPPVGGGNYTVSTNCAFAPTSETSIVRDLGSTPGHGTITGTTAVPGKYGNARKFNGSSDYLNIPDSTALDITGDFTISAWANRAGVGNNSLVSKVAGSPPSGGGYGLLTGNAGEVYCRTSDGPGWTDSFTATGLFTTSSGWTHLAIVRTGTSCRVWINGVDRTQTANTHTTLTANASNLTIGRRTDGSEYFNGQIDDVRIYNYARSESQVKDDMNEAPITTNLPVGWWKMDDGYIAGVDNGNITVQTGTTLTVNAGQTMVWNPGKSIIIENGGSIAINLRSRLKQSYLWYMDGDGDTYPTATNNKLRWADAAPGQSVRWYLANSASDCDDTHAGPNRCCWERPSGACNANCNVTGCSTQQTSRFCQPGCSFETVTCYGNASDCGCSSDGTGNCEQRSSSFTRYNTCLGPGCTLSNSSTCWQNILSCTWSW